MSKGREFLPTNDRRLEEIRSLSDGMLAAAARSLMRAADTMVV
jgi:hypothetical protein